MKRILKKHLIALILRRATPAAQKRRRLAGAALFIAFSLLCAACGGGVQNDPYVPIFTDPSTKLAETASSDFTAQLYNEAVAYEPLLVQSGAQVHMGYWSGAGNHGSLVWLLDAINGTPATAAPPQRAIWDEGATSSLQYPSYVTMIEEHWYERSGAVDGQVTIYGDVYADPFPVTFQEADDIWGQYSQRYADMAPLFKEATGNTVKSWCFVEGAKANRIFYTYELPELRTLEEAGAVQVFFAKTQDADWQNPDDWIEGTANAPEPVPADENVLPDIQAGPLSPRGIPWDAF